MWIKRGGSLIVFSGLFQGSENRRYLYRVGLTLFYDLGKWTVQLFLTSSWNGKGAYVCLTCPPGHARQRGEASPVDLIIAFVKGRARKGHRSLLTSRLLDTLKVMTAVAPQGVGHCRQAFN